MVWVRPLEQVAERAPVVGVGPAPPAVLGAVVEDVAALAERGEVVECAVARVVCGDQIRRNRSIPLSSGSILGIRGLRSIYRRE